MAENGENRDIPFTSNPRVDAALARIRGKFRDLEDAMLVQAQLAAGLSRQLKEHANVLDRILAAAERNEEEHRRFLEQQRKADERQQQLDERVDKLVIAIGQLIQRMPSSAPKYTKGQKSGCSFGLHGYRTETGIYALNELPQPQVDFTWGLLNLNPEPSSVST
jgi:hypothetical protein